MNDEKTVHPKMYTRILGVNNIILTLCNTYTVVNHKVTFN